MPSSSTPNRRQLYRIVYSLTQIDRMVRDLVVFLDERALDLKDLRERLVAIRASIEAARAVYNDNHEVKK